ncbi:MAG TPA: ABC transporter permease [Bryobacteraceae bacterium]|nr:ABC transporter permease [Bryobacteraceae bacterium]
MPESGFALRSYRWLLKLYPAGFRASYGDAMERQFLDEISDAHGPLSRAALWIRVLCDLAVSAPLLFAREIVQDSRHALRLWSRRPLHTGFAISALAIGIGANTGVFSVVNALLLRSLPFHDPDRLIATHWFLPPNQSEQQFHDWTKKSTYLEDATITYNGDANLGGTAESARVRLTQTSWNFFSLLGSKPWIGRTFAPGEDTPGKSAVAVIGYGLWQQLYAGNRAALGSIIRANGAPLTIIGVAPPGFDYPAKSVLWTPTAFSRDLIPATGFIPETVARLKPGLSWAQASEAFALDADRLAPPHSQAHNKRYPHPMTRLRDDLAGPVKIASLILMAGVGLILLIACTNVASLMLARTTERDAELSIRSALGASGARLAQQLLIESVLLSLAASAAGLLVARWTIAVATKVQPAPLGSQAYSVLDWRVLTFCIGVSILTGLLFGVLPSCYAGRAHNLEVIRSNRTRGQRLSRELLVAAQVAFTMILLACSFSIGRAFVHLMHADHGFDTKGLITVSASLEGTIHQGDGRELEYFEEALQRVRRLPGVKDASATGFLPLGATVFLGAPFGMDGRQPAEYSMLVPVLPHYFETIGGRILYGREFTDAEVRSDAPVALVNERFAAEFGHSYDALGRKIRLGTRYERQIIGVVRTTDYMADQNATQIFVPDHAPGSYFPTFVIRVDGKAEDHLATVRDDIQAIDRQVPVFAAKTMDERLDEALARPRFYSVAALFFAGFALLLAVIGIYGSMSYGVVQRTHELGVRLALGTTADRLRSSLLGQGLITVAAGAAVGIYGAMLSGRYAASLIAGAQSISAGVYIACVALMAFVATTAIWLATRRIRRLDIAEILRAD